MQDKDWIIELDKLDYQGYYKNGKKIVGRNHLLLIANGYIGVRGCFSELFNEKVDNSVHVIGIYDQLDYDNPEKDVWKEIINNPDFMSAPVTFDGEEVFLSQDAENFSDFRVWLNMRDATLTLQYIYTSKNGNRLQVEHNRFCAYHEKNLVYSTVQFISLDKDCNLFTVPGFQVMSAT
jgi:trehalose/maltose hydrolase-like predicted phosphorylase